MGGRPVGLPREAALHAIRPPWGGPLRAEKKATPRLSGRRPAEIAMKLFAARVSPARVAISEQTHFWPPGPEAARTPPGERVEQELGL